MRRGRVYAFDKPVGWIEEKEDKYTFSYDAEHLNTEGAQAVSLTLPLRTEPYVSKTMFPFFDGLIPEGWLLGIAVKNWKLNPRDRMGLLLTICQDCIGSVHVVAESRDK